MNCNCIESVDKKLLNVGQKLELLMGFSQKPLIATFCPFCGVKCEREEKAADISVTSPSGEPMQVPAAPLCEPICDSQEYDVLRIRLYGATARVEKMIWLDAMLIDHESVPDDLKNCLDDLDSADLVTLFSDAPDDVLESTSDGYELFLEWLVKTNKSGFLLKFDTPVKTYQAGKSTYWSWGHYATRWVYGATLDDALKAGFDFVEGQRAKEAKKAGCADKTEIMVLENMANKPGGAK